MKINKEYRIPVSVSDEAFVDKTISGAMIGTNTKENVEIRKQYGFKGNSTIHFRQTEVTPNECLDLLKKGHSMCNIFDYNKDKDYTTKSVKAKKHFKGAYAVCIDIDNTEYSDVDEFIEKLSKKPTLYYTTYSNKQIDQKTGENKGARFRLIYFFNGRNNEDHTPIKNPYIFRYCVYCINNMIENDTKEIIEDKCNQNCSQYFNGTNENAPDVVYKGDHLDYIYDLEDFNINCEGLKDFIINYCFYKTPDFDNIIGCLKLLQILDKNNTYYWKPSTKTFVLASSELSMEQVIKCRDNAQKCSEKIKRLLRGFRFEGYDKFMYYNRSDYKLFYRTEKDQWLVSENGIQYQYTDDNFIKLPYYKNKVQDGSKRRKKLFKRMCLRRLIIPGIDADTLAVNTYDDIHRFFETDQDLNIEWIISNVDKVMMLSIEDIKNSFYKNIKKQKMILKKGTCKGLADANRKYRIIRIENLNKYYDRNLTVKENQNILKTSGIETSIRSLYNYCKENNINPNPKKNTISDEEAKKLIDTNKSVRQNLEILKEKNLNISKDRISRLLNEKKANCPSCENIDSILQDNCPSCANIDSILQDNCPSCANIDSIYEDKLNIEKRNCPSCANIDSIYEKELTFNNCPSCANIDSIYEDNKDKLKNDSEIPQKKKISKREELNELKNKLTLDGITKDFLGIHNYTKDIEVRMISSNNQDRFESMFI